MKAASALGTARSLEAALIQLRGIRKARVDVGPDGDVRIEVLAVPERSEAVLRKHIVDVTRSLLPDDVRVSTSVLFAARRGTRGGEQPRRRLSSLISRRTHERFSTQVILSRGGDVATGEAQCHPLHHPERSVAQAVIDGLYDVSDRPLLLQHVETVAVGDATLALVSLSFGDRDLLGTAEIRFDISDAIVRATLHALNRSLTFER
jgi:hypothetical protein